jgi:hypothetical protein
MNNLFGKNGNQNKTQQERREYRRILSADHDMSCIGNFSCVLEQFWGKRPGALDGVKFRNYT